MAPAVVTLLIWMAVPLAMTLWFSFQRYNLLNPFARGFAGWDNYTYLLATPALTTALINTLILVGSVLLVTVVLGVLFAVLFDQEFWGRSVARLLVIAPFFTSFLIRTISWKILLGNDGPALAILRDNLGLVPRNFNILNTPLAVVLGLTYQALPFMVLPLYVALEKVDFRLVEAARDLFAGPWRRGSLRAREFLIISNSRGR